MTRVPTVADIFGLADRTVIVTGAGSGLGRRFAHVLDGAGASLVLAGRRRAPLDEVASELSGKVLVEPCDLSSDESVCSLAAAAKAHFGRIDVLVNNAGRVQAGPAFDEPAEEFRDVLNVDLAGTFLLAREVARGMSEDGGGAIVNITSIAGSVGTGAIPLAAYSAAKGGLIALTRELAAQWGKHGVRVNCLSPGWFGAGMGAWALDDEKGRTWLEGRTPLRRIGEPHELDGALLFLVSDASSYMTGHDLVVDGGWTIV